MSCLKVFGVVVTLMCLTASAKQDKEAVVPTSADLSRERVALAKTTKVERCLLLIGGRKSTEAPLVEYYHPTAECDITRISTERVEDIEFLSGCFLPGTQQIVIREGRILNKPPMLYPLSGGAATTLALPYSEYTSDSTSAMVGGSCVSCGGKTRGGEMVNECYSLSTSKWTSLPPLPQPLYHAASVALGADYYVIGGCNSTSEEESAQVYHYNTATNQWHTGTPMDDTRAYHSAAALSDTELIVCGGLAKARKNDTGWWPTWLSRRDCAIYSATTRRWSPAADMNQVRRHFAMVVFGGRVYALGGKLGWRMILDTVEVYDRAADSWTILDKKLKDERFAFVGLAV